MISYWVDSREEDKEDYIKHEDSLKGKIPLYLKVTNGLVDGFEVSNWFDTNLYAGFLYITRDEKGKIIQNIYLDEHTPAGNIAIELFDSIKNNEIKNQIDVRFCLDSQSKLNTKGILIIRIQIYGVLLEDLYSLYFNGNTIRKYGYMSADYRKRAIFGKKSNIFKRIKQYFFRKTSDNDESNKL